jgi:hypothetical protein
MERQANVGHMAAERVVDKGSASQPPVGKVAADELLVGMATVDEMEGGRVIVG